MLKITLVLASLTALIFYFFDQKQEERETATGIAAASFEKLATLPSVISESSGIEAMPTKGHYLTHNDAGNKPHLYEINEKGKLINTHKLNLPNVDWEDLAKDSKGNLYIADTGNNNNKRKELAVYKTSLENPKELQAIRFTYEDQKEYPPAKKEMNFDCEAIFWHGGNLYLVSRDRGQKQTAKVYQLPDQPGTHTAKLIGEHKLNAQVTGATISPDAQTVVLVSNEKLHLFRNVDKPAEFYKGDYKEIDLPNAGQTEAATFADENTLIITSEGSNLYRYRLQ